MTVVGTTPFRQERRYPDRTGPDERSIRIDWTRSLILESEDRTPDRCPGCEGRHIVKYGHTNKGTERYRCKGCGRTFTVQGVVSRSRLSEEQWMTFAECYVDGDSIERTAMTCGVSKSTVRRMRTSLDGLKWESIGENPHDGMTGRIFYSSGRHGALKAVRFYGTERGNPLPSRAVLEIAFAGVFDMYPSVLSFGICFSRLT